MFLRRVSGLTIAAVGIGVLLLLSLGERTPGQTVLPDSECRTQVCNKLKLTVVNGCQCDFTNSQGTRTWCFDATVKCTIPDLTKIGKCEGVCVNIPGQDCVVQRYICTIPPPPPPP